MIIGALSGNTVKVSRSDTVGGSTVVMERITQGSANGEMAIGATPPSPSGMFLTSIDADNNDGVISVKFTFQSQPPPQSQSGNSASGPQKNIKAISGATSTAPITMHPDFQTMYDSYGKKMNGGVVEWLDNAPQISGALSNRNSSINPLAGVQVYNKSTAVYSETKFAAGRENVSVAVEKVGKINAPTGAGGSGTEWLSCGASITQIGGDYRIDQKWMRDDRGFILDIYS